MRIQRFLTGLAAATLVAALTATPTRADTNVFADGGDIGVFKLTNNGGNNFTLDWSPTTDHRLNSVNGQTTALPVGTPANFGLTINFDLVTTTTTPIPGDGTVTTYEFKGGPFQKIFESNNGGANASLTYNTVFGVTSSGSPNGLLISGAILDVGTTGSLLNFTQNGTGTLPTDIYDFASMKGGTNTFSLTAAPTTGSASSFADLLSGSAGAFLTGGSLTFSEAPVPEPASLAIVGVSLVGLLGYRRLGKRTSKKA